MRCQRGSRGLRDTALEITKVSSSTLSQVRLYLSAEQFWSLRDFLIPTIPMSDYWTLNLGRCWIEV